MNKIIARKKMVEDNVSNEISFKWLHDITLMLGSKRNLASIYIIKFSNYVMSTHTYI